MGVVFDGLDSIFAANMTSCANALLRAINNRKYIFAVTLNLTRERLKSIEEKKKEKASKYQMQCCIVIAYCRRISKSLRWLLWMLCQSNTFK